MKRSQKKYVVLGFLILGLLGFMYFYSLKQFSVFDAAASYIVYPVLRINTLLIEPIKIWREERKNYSELHAQTLLLAQKNEDLWKRVISLESLIDYTQDTEHIHAFARRYDTAYMCSAQIIAKMVSEQQHYFLVDAGSSKGIELDMVAVYKNCLLGRVTEVYPWYSKVVLVTDNCCKVAAMCSQTKAHGIHEGSNKKEESQLSFVSRLEPLLVGDLVISSGEGLVFPRGFGLGTIKEFYANELYYTISIEPLMDFSHIKYCYLIKKGSSIMQYYSEMPS